MKETKTEYDIARQLARHFILTSDTIRNALILQKKGKLHFFHVVLTITIILLKLNNNTIYDYKAQTLASALRIQNMKAIKDQDLP